MYTFFFTLAVLGGVVYAYKQGKLPILDKIGAKLDEKYHNAVKKVK